MPTMRQPVDGILIDLSDVAAHMQMTFGAVVRRWRCYAEWVTQKENIFELWWVDESMTMMDET